jgi:hypothetical protein
MTVILTRRWLKKPKHVAVLHNETQNSVVSDCYINVNILSLISLRIGDDIDSNLKIAFSKTVCAV